MLRRIKNCWGRFRGYGGCERCSDTWNWKAEHYTHYGDGSACFPLCEMCWGELTPEERMPFYKMLYDKWSRDTSQILHRHIKWNGIEKAVMEGK